MKISEKCKVIAAGTIVAALMAGTALPALAISPAGCTSLAQIEEMNDDEEAQVQALKAAIAKVNVKYDEVLRSWQFNSPIYDKAEKNKTCCLSPWIYIFDGCKDVYFDEDFSYNGSSCIDLNTVYVRAGDNLYTYECDPDYTGKRVCSKRSQRSPVPDSLLRYLLPLPAYWHHCAAWSFLQRAAPNTMHNGYLLLYSLKY